MIVIDHFVWDIVCNCLVRNSVFAHKKDDKQFLSLVRPSTHSFLLLAITSTRQKMSTGQEEGAWFCICGDLCCEATSKGTVYDMFVSRGIDPISVVGIWSTSGKRKVLRFHVRVAGADIDAVGRLDNEWFDEVGAYVSVLPVGMCLERRRRIGSRT